MANTVGMVTLLGHLPYLVLSPTPPPSLFFTYESVLTLLIHRSDRYYLELALTVHIGQ